MSRCMAIDYGVERTGLAISDPEGKLAFPLATLRLGEFKNRAAMLDYIAGRANRENAEILVIGLPLHTDGKENPMCRQVRNFAARLSRRSRVPIYLEPETLTSDAALRDLAECGVKKAKIKNILDQQAACEILNSFLRRPVPMRIPFG